MAKIDLTKNNGGDEVEAIEKIKFYTYRKGVYSHKTAQELRRASSSSENRTKSSIVFISNINDPNRNLMIDSEEQVDKLIKALELAKKLNWFYKGE